jgi:hypothetical protein
MIEKLIQKSHGAGIGGVSSLVHKLVKLNPIKQTRNELKLGVVKIAQAFTTNVPTLGVRAGFRRTKLSTQHKSPIGKLNLNLSTSPRMTPNVCWR